MLNILKNKKIIIFAFLLLTVTSVFIAHNGFNKKEVVKVFEETKVNKKQFAMYVENENGEFVEYNDSELFPDSSMYTFNEEKSYCVDNKDNVLENVISYDSGKVTITSNKSLYCYLYFDGDSIPPIISVDIIDNYYTSAKLSILSNENGTYCVNTSNIIGDISNCMLQGNVIENVAIRTSNFTTSNQYYVHVKDSAGNETMSEALDIKVLYQKVEYIQSSGTQYINTGFIPNQNTRIVLDYENLGDTLAALFGGRTGTSSKVFGMWLESSIAYPHYGNTSHKATPITIDTTDRLIYDMNKNIIKIGANTVTATSATFNSGYSLTIFGLNSAGNVDSRRVSGKMYSVQIYDNGTLVRDFVPVYRVSDNVVGMFDEVNKVFYTNSGTGNFGKGEDINKKVNSVLINGGASSTNSTSVILTLSSSGAKEMCISNTTSCSSWESYVTSKSHTIATGDGTKTVYVWYKDEYGNISDYVTDTIKLDTANYLCTTNTLFVNCLKSNPPKGFSSTSGYYQYYRFVGAEVDNYIKLGNVMYRIIGVVISNNSNTGEQKSDIRLIKETPLNIHVWHSDSTLNIEWENSIIYEYLQSNNVLGNPNVIPSEWSERIVPLKWYIGDVESTPSASNMHIKEGSLKTETSIKIGMMSLIDYSLAYLLNGEVDCSSTICQSWLTPTQNEWVRSRYGLDNSMYKAWYINKDGKVYKDIVTSNYAIRPVFNLSSSVNYVSGTGTSTDPFIIS